MEIPRSRPFWWKWSWKRLFCSCFNICGKQNVLAFWSNTFLTCLKSSPQDFSGTLTDHKSYILFYAINLWILSGILTGPCVETCFQLCRCFCTAAGWVGTNSSLRVQTRRQQQMSHMYTCEYECSAAVSATQVPALEGTCRDGGAALHAGNGWDQDSVFIWLNRCSYS